MCEGTNPINQAWAEVDNVCSSLKVTLEPVHRLGGNHAHQKRGQVRVVAAAAYLELADWDFQTFGLYRATISQVALDQRHRLVKKRAVTRDRDGEEPDGGERLPLRKRDARLGLRIRGGCNLQAPDQGSECALRTAHDKVGNRVDQGDMGMLVGRKMLVESVNRSLDLVLSDVGDG
jgi:hypothetical protein